MILGGVPHQISTNYEIWVWVTVSTRGIRSTQYSIIITRITTNNAKTLMRVFQETHERESSLWWVDLSLHWWRFPKNETNNLQLGIFPITVFLELNCLIMCNNKLLFPKISSNFMQQKSHSLLHQIYTWWHILNIWYLMWRFFYQWKPGQAL